MMVEDNGNNHNASRPGETAGGEDFAELLEKSLDTGERLKPGQKVSSRVIGITGDSVYIDLGGKSDGIIDLGEFTDEHGEVQIKEGDEIQAFFVSMQDGIRKLTTLINGYSAANLGEVQAASEAGLPVQGEVKREIKGGFEVSVNGIRCFCPFSQIDLSGGREGGIYLGQTFSFKVLEFEENGRNVVVSRRALLEKERQERIGKLKETLAVDTLVTGEVRSLHHFGAFVDIGGIDGMIPASELSWNKADRPEQVLSVGQKVTVKIIAVDWARDRITLSLKALQPDPWASVAGKYRVDGQVHGTVVRLVPFGAFVNLEPGVDGLIHISNFGAGRRINHPKEVVQAGQEVDAYVLAVDPEHRKISLSLQPRPKPKEIVLPAKGEFFEGTVEKIMPYGVFLKITDDLTGLVPNAEMDTPVGSDHERMFPQGSKLKVVVIDTDAKTGKVRLSRKGLTEKIEKEEYRKYKESVKQEEEKTSNGIGSLGQLLKAKMEEKGYSV